MVGNLNPNKVDSECYYFLYNPKTRKRGYMLLVGYDSIRVEMMIKKISEC